jgi:hypothetical protein
MFKKFLSALLLVWSLGSGAQAQSHHGPFHHHYVHSGVYAGWGYYPIVNGYWGWRYYHLSPWAPYGYSYLGYWNYQPYYASFGSISYSPSTDKVGVAWGQPNLATSSTVSNAYCAVADCATVVWVQGGCAAVARSAEAGHVYWGYHANRTWSDTNALRACVNNGGTDCKLAAWVCSN